MLLTLIFISALLLSPTRIWGKQLLDDTNLDTINAQGQTPLPSDRPARENPGNTELSDEELEKLIGGGHTVFSPLDMPNSSINGPPLQDYFNPHGTQFNWTSGSSEPPTLGPR